MTDDHLSLDELAELDEGLLPPERTSAARAHLHGCAECRSRADAITATQQMLGDLPPDPMPADVIARLDAALADAAAAVPEPRAHPGASALDKRDDSNEDARRDIGSDTVMPAPGSVSRPRFGRPSMPALATAAVFVLAAGAIVLGHLNHHSSTPTPTAGAGSAAATGGSDIVVPRAQNASVTVTSSGTRYTTTNLATSVQGLLHRGPTATLSPSSASGFGTDSTSGGTNQAPTSSGSGVTGGSNGGAARSGRSGGKQTRKDVTNAPTVNSQATVSTPAPLTAPTPRVLLPLATSRNQILKCAQTLTGQLDAVPLQVDFARWSNGKYTNAPSAIFVFNAKAANTVAVYVTNPTCSGNSVIRDFTEIALP